MKKILYVTNITRTVNTFFIPHMNMLVNEGCQVDCACKISGEHKLNEAELNKDIKFYDVPFTRNPLNIDNIKAFLILYKLQKEKKYDCIHVHTPIAAVYTRLLKVFLKDVNIIYTAHGYHFYKGASKINWIVYYSLEKFLARFTDVLITINNEDYEVSKNFKCGRLVKMNGVGVDLKNYYEIEEVEKNKIRKSLGFKEDDFILIMVGEHNSNKNQIQLIKAIEELSEEEQKIKAIFIGDGELVNQNKQYIESRNINNIEILGFRKDVLNLVNISDVLVSMSHREGLPKNIIEGMACGKPIIATNIRGNSDLVKNSENGILVSVGNVIETKDAILKLYKSSNMLLDMGEKSKEMAQAYRIEEICKEISGLYFKENEK